MKKIITLFFLTIISMSAIAQTNGHICVHASTLSGTARARNSYMIYSYISLWEDGDISYFKGNDNGDGSEKKGKYAIKDGKIFITWPNGHKETATITYESSGFAVITYNNIKMYEKNTID